MNTHGIRIINVARMWGISIEDAKYLIDTVDSAQTPLVEPTEDGTMMHEDAEKVEDAEDAEDAEIVEDAGMIEDAETVEDMYCPVRTNDDENAVDIWSEYNSIIVGGIACDVCISVSVEEQKFDVKCTHQTDDDDCVINTGLCSIYV